MLKNLCKSNFNKNILCDSGKKSLEGNEIEEMIKVIYILECRINDTSLCLPFSRLPRCRMYPGQILDGMKIYWQYRDTGASGRSRAVALV